MNIVLTGATSYVGKRLLLELFYFSYKTVCTIRDKSRFSAHTSLTGRIDAIEANFLDFKSLKKYQMTSKALTFGASYFQRQ